MKLYTDIKYSTAIILWDGERDLVNSNPYVTIVWHPGSPTSKPWKGPLHVSRLVNVVEHNINKIVQIYKHVIIRNSFKI